MSLLTERVQCKELLDKLMPVEEAVKLVGDRCKIAISGFTKTGEPKAFLPELARHLTQYAPKTKIGLFPKM
jgi:acyl-CoA hydrolase